VYRHLCAITAVVRFTYGDPTIGAGEPNFRELESRRPFAAPDSGAPAGCMNPADSDGHSVPHLAL
jgi:hypothetical protein